MWRTFYFERERGGRGKKKFFGWEFCSDKDSSFIIPKVSSMETLGVLLDGNVLGKIPQIKKILAGGGVYDQSRRLCADAKVAVFPVRWCNLDQRERINAAIFKEVGATVSWVENAPNAASKRILSRQTSPLQVLACLIDELVKSYPGGLTRSEFKASLPVKYEMYDRFVLFAEHSFEGSVWPRWYAHLSSCIGSSGENAFFKKLSTRLGKDLIAVKQRIPVDDVQRRPQIKILYCSNAKWLRQSDVRDPCLFNESFWTGAIQVGIRYEWCPFFTMFSAGNISEKQRLRNVFQKSVEGEVLVDLYAGIGYWSLLALRYGKFSMIHACELNPWSVEGLRRGIQGNKLAGQIAVHLGNNESSVPNFVASANRVILGLIPSSKQGWPLAVRAMHPRGAIFHVHMNLTEPELDGFVVELQAEIRSLIHLLRNDLAGQNVSFHLLHTEKVKSYAPKVNHYVFDLQVCVGHSVS